MVPQGVDGLAAPLANCRYEPYARAVSMTEIKAVRDPGPDPKAGKPKARSTVEFPYYDLDASVEVARTIHEKAGGICERAALAGYLNYSSQTNGSFLTRVAAARLFGFIEPAEAGALRITDRGRAI